MKIEDPAKMINKRLESQVRLGAEVFRAICLSKGQRQVNVVLSRP